MAGLADAVMLLQAKNYSGSGNWLDESGNSHDGVITNAVFTDGDHFYLDEAGDYITVSDHADLDFAALEDFTLMVSLEYDATASIAWPIIAGKKATSGGVSAGYTLYAKLADNEGYMAIADGAAAASEFTGNDQIPFGTPVVFTGVRNAQATIEVFIDGVSKNSAADGTTLTLAQATDFIIGDNGNLSGATFKGKIFAVALWRSALSAADIAAAGVALQSGQSMTLLGVG